MIRAIALYHPARPTHAPPEISAEIVGFRYLVEHDEDAERGHDDLMGIWSSGCLCKKAFAKLIIFYP